MSELFERVLSHADDIYRGKVSVTARQRLQVDANAISRAGDLQAHLNAVEAALMRLVGILYEPDAAGHPANYDRFTGQILIPLPWGKSGWSKWGLRQWEAVCLRKILLFRSQRPSKHHPILFDWNIYARRWNLRTDLYPTADHAISWVQRDGPKAHEWEQFAGELAAYHYDKNRSRSALRNRSSNR